MSDYISREWLLDVVENIIEWDTERDRNRAIHQVRELTPAADAIEQLEKKVTEWQEEACKWNNEYFALRDSMPRWISVKERLPEYGEVVLVSDGIDVGTGWLDKRHMKYDTWHTPFADIEEDNVLWWMPLPKVPKEDE